MKKLVIFYSSLLLAFFASAAQQAADSTFIVILERSLSYSDNPGDSAKIYYNMFDVEPVKAKRVEYGMKVIECADRANNIPLQFDMIRNLATFRDPELLINLLKINADLPESQDRRKTNAFIKMMQNYERNYNSADKDDPERYRELLIRVNEVDKQPDIYAKIVRLHAVVLYLSELGQTDLLVGYINEMQHLVEQIPETDHLIRNAFYVQAANAYTSVGMAHKAVETDKMILDICDQLDKLNHRIGRKYKSYDSNRYIVYTRMLENMSALSPDEVEDIYRNVQTIVKNDLRSKNTFAIAPYPAIYYNYYHKNYDLVTELIENCIDNPYTEPKRRQLTKMLVESTNATGTTEEKLKAATEYYKILEDFLNNRLQEKYRQLELQFSLDEVKELNAKMEMRSLREHKALVWVSIAASIVALLLLIMVVVLWHVNRKSRKLVNAWEESTKALEQKTLSLRVARDEIEAARNEAQRANKLKTEFINNMSHEVSAPLQAITEYTNLVIDNVEDSKRPYLNQYVELIMLNCDMLNTIVNDVLQLSELYNSTLEIIRRPTSLNYICSLVVDSVAHRLNPGVKLTFNNNPENPQIVTDQRRLVQILTNLLVNAAKFTKEGSIDLSYKLRTDNMVEIAVTDTGCGIDPYFKERIFERFIKLDKDSQGVGLGLTIAREIARALGGDILLDTDYKKGARFVVTIPIK